MRIALCISGQLRDWYGTYYSLINKISPCDVFVSTWKSDSNQAFFQTVKPLKISITDFDSFKQQHRQLITTPYYKGRLLHDDATKSCTNTEASMAMFFNIWRCNELKRQHEFVQGFKYDVVLRLRTELTFVRLPKITWFREIANGDQRIYIPYGYEWGGITDLFAMGCSQSMDRYASIWKQLTPETPALAGPFLKNNESLLLHHLNTEDIQFRKAPMKIILRDHRIDPPLSQRIATSPMGATLLSVVTSSIPRLKRIILPIIPRPIKTWGYRYLSKKVRDKQLVNRLLN